MTDTTKTPIDAFPIRKVCGKGRGTKHTCQRAPVVCGRCLQRGCAHTMRGSVRVDIGTAEQISPMDARPNAITIGTCGACGGKGWMMADAIEKIRSAVLHLGR